MSPTRLSTPPPREIKTNPDKHWAPSSPAFPGTMKSNSAIAGPEHALVPPSPGATGFDTSSHGKDQAAARKLRANTGAGVKRNRHAKSNSFRFLDLPGEIRNLIYDHTRSNPKQALLVHRPRLASLRARTRQDRSRPLASEIEGHEHDKELELVKYHRTMYPNDKVGSLARDSNRPFFGLTQVCQSIRQEFRPIYLRRQEIGMDLTEIVKYLQTFYADARERLDNLEAPGTRKHDLPFTGNLTIAVGDRANATERAADGVDVYPMLDLWANSYKIEAGFGRYLRNHYVPESDGEAKDLYRLFGRRVLPNRMCSTMNGRWRSILRSRSLAAILVHRQHTRPTTPMTMPGGGLPQVTYPPLAGNGAYIHIVFKKAFAEPWMTAFESAVPTNWLDDHGFYLMEYYDVKVGIEQ